LVRVKTQRDKHGGETVLLTHGGTDGTATVVIYAHRTIPGLRMARHPFDEETIGLLERTYPQLEFDWARILRTAAASVAAGVPEAPIPQRPVRGRPPVADEGGGANRRRGQEGGRAPQPRDVRRPRADNQIDDGQAQAPDSDLPETAVAIPEAAPQAQFAEPTPIGRGGLDAQVDHAVTSQGVEPPGTPAAEPPAFSVLEDDGADEDGPEEEDGTREQRAEGEGATPSGSNAARTLSAGSVAERHAALVQRIQQRVRDPRRQAVLLAQVAALEPSQWVEPLDLDGAARFEQIHSAIRRQLPSRRRRARRPGPGGAAHRSPSSQGGRKARPEPAGE
jgi:hypothetical protein